MEIPNNRLEHVGIQKADFVESPYLSYILRQPRTSRIDNSNPSIPQKLYYIGFFFTLDSNFVLRQIFHQSSKSTETQTLNFLVTADFML